jgi:hypothetical protein
MNIEQQTLPTNEREEHLPPNQLDIERLRIVLGGKYKVVANIDGNQIERRFYLRECALSANESYPNFTSGLYRWQPGQRNWSSRGWQRQVTNI